MSAAAVPVRSLLAAAALVLAACGTQPKKPVYGPETPSPSPAPAPAPTPDPTPAPPAETLTVDIPAGVWLVQHPVKGEGHGMSGLIAVTLHVKDDSQPVSDAAVRINGVAVPAAGGVLAGTGFYDLSKLAADTVKAGQTVTLEATKGALAAKIEFRCPEPAITSPEDDTVYAPGSSFDLKWTGATHFAAQLLPPSTGMFDLYDHASGSTNQVQKSNVQAGQTKATFSLPDEYWRSFAAQLVVPGEFADTAQGSGQCVVVRRVRVHTEQPL